MNKRQLEHDRLSPESLAQTVEALENVESPDDAVGRVIDRALAIETSKATEDTNTATDSRRVPTTTRLPETRSNTGIWRWAATLATAACLVIALTFLPGKTVTAFEQVQNALANIKTIQFVGTLTSDSNNEALDTFRCSISQPDLFHQESVSQDGQLKTQIFDFERETGMVLFPVEKVANIFPIYETEIGRLKMANVLALLRGESVTAEFVGEKQLDGNNVVEYLVPTEMGDFQVFVDKQSKLPVKLIRVSLEGEDHTMVFDEFVFDEPLDASLFVVEAPQGYKVNRQERREAVLSDVNIVLTPGVGLGDAKFGMDKDSVIENLGQPDKVSEVVTQVRENDNGEREYQVRTLDYDSRGIQIVVEEGRGLIQIACMGVTGMDGNRGFKGFVGEGIRMGASAAEVQNAYGAPTETESTAEVLQRLIYVTTTEVRTSFLFENDKLMMVITSHYDRE